MDYTLLYPAVMLLAIYLWFTRPPNSGGTNCKFHATTENSHELREVRKVQHEVACTGGVSITPQYHWGRYKQPIVNPIIHTKSFFGNILKDFRLKRWHYLSVTTPTHLVSLAIVQVGYVANVWCYVFNPARTSEPLQEFRLLSPLGMGVSFSQSSCSGVTEWRSGKRYIKITSEEDKFVVEVDAMSNGVEFKGKFDFLKPKKSLALLYPLETPASGFPRAAYTHKAAGLKASGHFSCAGETISLDGGLACTDWTKSFARRETRWRWVSFSAHVEEGGVRHEVGLNLSSDVYEDTENVLFVDGKMYPQGAITITKPSPAEYRITTANGTIDLTFTQIAYKEENVNMFIIKDKFVQACGLYSGEIRVEKGNETRMVLHIDRCIGVYEDHYALW